MTITATQSLINKIETALSQIRPFLLEDGGDVELVDITDELVVRVRFKGACKTCNMSNMTFTAGVEDSIRRNAPEIKRVEIVSK